MMRSPAADDGFTLLEVVVAIAVLSMSLAVLYPVFWDAPRRLAQTELNNEAARYAFAKFEEETLLQNWTMLPRTGAGDGWNWKLEEIADEEAENGSGASSDGELVHVRFTLTKDGNEQFVPVVFDRVVWVTGR